MLTIIIAIVLGVIGFGILLNLLRVSREVVIEMNEVLNTEETRMNIGAVIIIICMLVVIFSLL